jgi:F420-0:gamma-glutamyl ligase
VFENIQQEANLNKINTLPHDTFNLKLSDITDAESIRARLKNVATVDNVGVIISDSLTRE